VGLALALGPVAPPVVDAAPVPALAATSPRPAERSRIEPVGAERWHWRITLDAKRKAKLDRLKDILSHKFPDGDPEKLFDQMLDDCLEKQGKPRGYVEPSRPRKPAPPKAPTPGQRAPVPLPVRREVLKRDGYRCTFMAEDGARCACTTRLEMDHLEPAAETGSSRVEDLTTRCRSHNQWRAVVRYGAEYVKRRISAAREARRERPTSEDEAHGRKVAKASSG
jgi:5-methylcytosine-specific restriction endonuclease McrA